MRLEIAKTGLTVISIACSIAKPYGFTGFGVAPEAF